MSLPTLRSPRDYAGTLIRGYRMSLLAEEFLPFLLAAKRATYASAAGRPATPALLPDARQFEFADGEFLYRDSYVGVARFAGQEIVYRGDQAVWSMGYAGGLAPGVAPAAAGRIYDALRAALAVPPPERPLRGPAEFQADDLHYRCAVVGDWREFHGAEAIHDDGGAGLYELRFCGGVVSG